MKVQIVETKEIIELDSLIRRIQNSYNPVRIVQKESGVEIQQMVKLEEEIQEDVELKVPVRFLGYTINYKKEVKKQPKKVWKDDWQKVNCKIINDKGEAEDIVFKTIDSAKIFIEQFKLREVRRIESSNKETIHYL